MRRKYLISFVLAPLYLWNAFIVGLLLDMFNDYFVTDKFFKTNGRIFFRGKQSLPNIGPWFILYVKFDILLGIINSFFHSFPCHM